MEKRHDAFRKILQNYLTNFPINEGKKIIYNSLCKKLAGAEQVVKTRDGFLMHLDPTDLGQKYIYWYGRYNEQDEIKIVRSLLQPGDCFIDVGAHIGYFSLTAAKIVGRNGKVVSFEPNPYTYYFLKRNIEINDFSQIELHKKAVADCPGYAAFYFKRDTADFGASLNPMSRHEISENVELTTLDFISKYTPTMLKIDAEGIDEKILLGAKNLLCSTKIPILLVETLNLDSDAFKMLVSLEYERFCLVRHVWIKSSTESIFKSNNTLWIKREAFKKFIPRIEKLVKL